MDESGSQYSESAMRLLKVVDELESFLEKRPVSLDGGDGVSLAQVERVKMENQRLKEKHDDVKYRLDQMISKIKHQMEVRNNV